MASEDAGSRDGLAYGNREQLGQMWYARCGEGCSLYDIEHAMVGGVIRKGEQLGGMLCVVT